MQNLAILQGKQSTKIGVIMQVFIASDHAGFGLKEFVKKVLLARGLEVCDFGVDS